MSRSHRTPSWIDISAPLHEGLVHWPDNPPFTTEPVLAMEKGDACNVSRVCMGTHTGTHVDAPRHFLASGRTIDDMPLAAMMGRARIVEIRDERAIDVPELQPHGLQAEERILFKTRNSRDDWPAGPFRQDFVAISESAARFLAARRVRLVGVDYLSAGSPETHRVLLGSDIWIVEGLHLAGVGAGEYEFVCLPLKIIGGDAAPARAAVRPVIGEAPAA